MVKKVKTKQRQKQRQKQSVIVNVNLAKHTAPRISSSRPAHNRQQLPAPIYTSPIQGLVPQIFTKEGKQTSQPTIADQIEKYLEISKFIFKHRNLPYGFRTMLRIGL